jgi:LL-diaminopimelate aminotransferase
LFSEFQRKKKEMEENGVDVIDLGIGAPDLPAPPFVYERLVEEAKKPLNHKYSIYSGVPSFREAVAAFYKKQYDVTLDPETEVLTLIGSKEGIANLITAVTNPGDTVIIPDPGYPVYRAAAHLAGAVSVSVPLDVNNGYAPLYDKLTAEELAQAKLMFLNYPSNPTAATVGLDTFSEAVAFAEKHNMLLVNDAAYDLITFDDYTSPSVLQAPGAKKHAVEFGSLSKSFNMTGWRIGFAVGNREAIQALATLKSNVDTSQFIPVQKAAEAALKSDLSAVKENNLIYKKRMEKMHKALNEMGIQTEKPRGTIFVWSKVPDGYTSAGFADKILQEAGVIVTPGNAFGDHGEGFIRIALTVSEERLDEVITRLRKIF